jgi:N-carbamoylputrescine amidase
MSDTFKVGLIQEQCVSDYETNINSRKKLIAEAAGKGAQIIALSELFSSPYFCTVEDHKFFELAEPKPFATVETFQPIARQHGVVLVVPFYEKRAPGVYHNSTAVIDADGTVLGVYRKMHIPDDPLYYEKFFFTPADAKGENGGFKVFDTKFAKVGVLICWDQWYPEAARITALMGAEVLFYPTAIGWHPREKDEYGETQKEAWRTIQRSHAIANGVYVAAVNRIGHEPTPGTDGIEFFGHSFISDPFGKIIADSKTEPTILLAECSKKHQETTRRHWPFLRDRRIDAYQPILSRFL